jgi:hypothetical protein
MLKSQSVIISMYLAYSSNVRTRDHSVLSMGIRNCQYFDMSYRKKNETDFKTD